MNIYELGKLCGVVKGVFRSKSSLNIIASNSLSVSDRAIEEIPELIGPRELEVRPVLDFSEAEIDRVISLVDLLKVIHRKEGSGGQDFPNIRFIQGHHLVFGEDSRFYSAELEEKFAETAVRLGHASGGPYHFLKVSMHHTKKIAINSYPLTDHPPFSGGEAEAVRQFLRDEVDNPRYRITLRWDSLIEKSYHCPEYRVDLSKTPNKAFALHAFRGAMTNKSTKFAEFHIALANTATKGGVLGFSYEL